MGIHLNKNMQYPRGTPAQEAERTRELASCSAGRKVGKGGDLAPLCHPLGGYAANCAHPSTQSLEYGAVIIKPGILF